MALPVCIDEAPVGLVDETNIEGRKPCRAVAN